MRRRAEDLQRVLNRAIPAAPTEKKLASGKTFERTEGGAEHAHVSHHSSAHKPAFAAGGGAAAHVHAHTHAHHSAGHHHAAHVKPAAK